MLRIALPILLLLLLIGVLVFLSTQAREVPTRTIEVDVSAPANVG